VSDDMAAEQNGDEVFEDNNNVDELTNDRVKYHSKLMVSDHR